VKFGWSSGNAANGWEAADFGKVRFESRRGRFKASVTAMAYGSDDAANIKPELGTLTRIREKHVGTSCKSWSVTHVYLSYAVRAP